MNLTWLSFTKISLKISCVWVHVINKCTLLCDSVYFASFIMFCTVGITPMLQIISAVIKDSEDKTNITLLFANQVCASASGKYSRHLCGLISHELEVYFPPSFLSLGI